ncbi:MAG: polysaccharide biosynthesis tyrosine autokinase [Actinomycetota bacterium]|nr:polysaccharide biosynthesis tyrosine autokinase [Actinomycetota bacterium]
MVVLVCAAISVIFTLVRPPVYRATAQVLLPETANDVVPSVGAAVQPNDPSRVLANAIQVIKGPEVRAGVRVKLGRSAPGISVTAVTQTDVIQMAATGATADGAAAVANAYAGSYLDLRRKQIQDANKAAGQDVQREIDDLQAQIAQAQGPDRDSLIQAQASLRERLAQLRVRSSDQLAGPRLLAPGVAPTSPAGIKPLPAALYGIALGLVLGIGGAFARDFLDDSVRTKEELEGALSGLPVVGLIPAFRNHQGNANAPLLTSEEPQSAAAEAYRTLRTAVQFLDVDHQIRTLQITSPTLQEGKTTTVANLGLALAQSDHRIVIVCCDLRRPRIHEFFDLDNETGLTSVIAGRVSLRDAVRDVADRPWLRVLTSGPIPPNPAELLSSNRTTQVLGAVRESCDLVLLDCPPVLPVADSLVVAASCDASLLVCRAGTTSRKDLLRAVELLRQVGAPLVGSVLNAAPSTAVYGGDYGYYEEAAIRSAVLFHRGSHAQERQAGKGEDRPGQDQAG